MTDPLERVHKSFAAQAVHFEDSSMSFSKEEYLRDTVRRIGPTKTDSILEVASGTCACGRALAPYAACVTCLDTTPQMLKAGRDKAAREEIHNVVFVQGRAENLPFPDACFDVVLSRLAFHHFPEVTHPFGEMVRVLRRGGRLVLMDMAAAGEGLREREDALEKLRDPSHVKNLSVKEMRGLYESAHLTLFCCEGTEIPVSRSAWTELTKTPAGTRERIVRAMAADISGEARTGFHPYLQNGELWFHQRRQLLIGRK